MTLFSIVSLRSSQIQKVEKGHELLCNLLNFKVVINDDGILLVFSDLEEEHGAEFKIKYEMVGEDRCRMVGCGLVEIRENEEEIMFRAKGGANVIGRIAEECGNSERWRPEHNEVIEPHKLNEHYERGTLYFSSLASLCRQLGSTPDDAPYILSCNPLVVDDSVPPVCDYLIVDVAAREIPQEVLLKIGIRCDREVAVDTIFRDGKEVEEVAKWIEEGVDLKDILLKVMEQTTRRKT